MAKEVINNFNGCDEVVMSVANVEDLNGAKWTYAVKISLVRFTLEMTYLKGALRS